MARSSLRRKFKIGVLSADLSKLKTKPIDDERLEKINAARAKLKEKGLYIPVVKVKKEFKPDFKQTPKLEKFIKPLSKKSARKKRKKRTAANQIALRKKMPYVDFLKSDYWKQVRKLVLKRDGRMCVICRETKQLDIHHDTYKNHGDEMNHLDDLMTLCRKCHKEHHDAQK